MVVGSAAATLPLLIHHETRGYGLHSRILANMYWCLWCGGLGGGVMFMAHLVFFPALDWDDLVKLLRLVAASGVLASVATGWYLKPRPGDTHSS